LAADVGERDKGSGIKGMIILDASGDEGLSSEEREKI